MKLSISLIIVAYNEELNIEYCLKNAKDHVAEIFVVDSYSTDRTKEICEKYGAKVVEHEFQNQAQQFNWALDNLDFENEWIMRLDADEYVLPELWQEIGRILPNTPKSVNGFYMKRRVYFMGRWMRHGGYYPTWILRLFRKDKARSEEREMDEHIVLLDGEAGRFKNDFVDENRKGLEFWTDKHNKFSSREVKEFLKAGKDDKIKAGVFSGPIARKRLAKKMIYDLPPFFRVFAYFIYRYFFRLGFLDGKEGMIFHFLQGFWYRFLIDAKLYEMENNKFKHQIQNKFK